MMTSPSHGSGINLIRVVIVAGVLVLIAAFFRLIHAGRSEGVYFLPAESNLRRILTSAAIYCDDYDGILPQYGHWETEKPFAGPWIKGDQMAWREILEPYVVNEDWFLFSQWPFREQEGARLELVRGVTNGASCYGYVAEITPKWFGSKDGSLHLNPADPPEGFLKELGVDQANAPLLEDLAWIEKGRFGQVHVHRILDKSTRPGQKVVGYMDGHVKTIPATESGQAEPSKLR